MGTKVCSECKKEYPKTNEYFFTKRYKEKLKTKLVEYVCFRSTCKKCHSKLTTEKNRDKRIKELGCTLETYEETYRKIIADKNKKYKQLSACKSKDNLKILWKKRRVVKKNKEGYNYTSIEEYDADKTRRISKARRKHNYGDCEKVSTKMRNEMVAKVLPDSKVAQIMGYKINELPKEILEVKRNMILLKREIGIKGNQKF